jgi:hypothetical protein
MLLFCVMLVECENTKIVCNWHSTLEMLAVDIDGTSALIPNGT